MGCSPVAVLYDQALWQLVQLRASMRVAIVVYLISEAVVKSKNEKNIVAEISGELLPS